MTNKKYYKKSTETYTRMLRELRHTPVTQADGTIKRHKIVDGFDAKDGFDIRSAKSWTPAQKSLITRYHNEIDQLLARPVHVYKPRLKKHLKKAQQYAQHEVSLPKLKAALIPVYGELAPKVTFTKKDDIKVEYNGSIRTMIDIAPEELFYDLRGSLRDAIEDKAPDADTFLIQAGKYEMPNILDEESAGDQMLRLQTRYSVADNHHWSNWLHGVIAFKSEEMFDTIEMIRSKVDVGVKYRKERVRARKAQRRDEELPAKLEKVEKMVAKLRKQNLKRLDKLRKK